MRLSWIELSILLSDKLQENDYRNLAPLLENVLALNESYATKPLYFDRINLHIKELSQFMVNTSISNEQITQKMRMLCDCMQEVVKSKIKPLMFAQTWYMDRMRALGYSVNRMGQCYGMSQMAIQAFLANDMETFNTRLQIIYNMPLEDFENDFANLKDQRQQFLDKGQEASANKINEKIIDLYAFFDGVSLHQNPDMYLYDEDYQPLSIKQNSQITMPITLPVILETNKRSPSAVASFTGHYNKKDLIDYFSLLKNELGENSFALNIVGENHSISLAYDASNERWLLLDPDHLPGEEYISGEHLAAALFSLFLGTNYMTALVLGTKIITTIQSKQQMQLQFENLKKNTIWSALHDEIKSIFSYTGFVKMTPSILYNRLHKNSKDILGDDDILTNLINRRMNDTITRFINTKSKEALLKMSCVLLAQVLLTVSKEEQQKLLEKISFNQKVDIINTLYEYFKKGKNQVYFQRLPEREQLPVFLKLPSLAQGQLLVELTNAALIEQRNELLQPLSIDQKEDLIKAVQANSGYTLFQILPEQEQLSVFLKLQSKTQGDLLINLTDAALIEQRNQLLRHLPTEHKVSLINVIHPIFFNILLEQEKLSVFPKLQPHVQEKLLVELTEKALIEQRSILIEQLSVEQKAIIINRGSLTAEDMSSVASEPHREVVSARDNQANIKSEIKKIQSEEKMKIENIDLENKKNSP